MTRYPEPVVGAFIFNNNNQLLLLQSHKWQNKYLIPGGHLELGETIADGLKREVKEETGLEIYDQQFICIHEFLNEAEYYKKSHMLLINYRVKTDSEKVNLNEEAERYFWVMLRDALKLPLEKYTRLTIEQYLLK